MQLYKVIDYNKLESIHTCPNEEIAKQAHLIHHNLKNAEFKSIDIIDYKDIDKKRCTNKKCLTYIAMKYNQINKTTYQTHTKYINNKDCS